ncbi:MAG: hypothetical protein ACPGU5_04925 [Lishizhenia sp.]
MQKTFFILFIICAVLVGCKTTNNHPVQPPPFQLQVNLTLPSYAALQGISGYAYVSGGIKGIVIYRKSQNEFVAFDRMSTTENAADCESGVVINEDNFLVLDDPCSDTQYSLYDGSIVTGDVEWGLRGYIVQFDGSNTLTIQNQ